MFSRGQAALEFLMSYGWAILVVSVTISIIAYFGVPYLQTEEKNRCMIEFPFSCIDASYNNSITSLVISYNGNYDISNINISIKGNICTGKNIMNQNDKEIFLCTGLLKPFSEDLMIEYTNSMSAFSHRKTGIVRIN